jgi:uncharacterized membrane protein YbhN (UPF0104 family)
MAPATSLPRSRPIRFFLGAVLGLGLLIFTLARVDLGETVSVIADAAAGWLVLGVAVVLVDLVVRAARWRSLLSGLPEGDRVPLILAIAYLTIGYLANALLPARLGDLARAYLAGTSFRVARLAVLGTIVVERVADGGTMLGLAVASTLLVSGIATVRTLIGLGLVLAAAGALVLVAGWWLVARTPVATTTVGSRVRDLAGRIGAGLAALRTPRTAAAVALATGVAAGTSTLTAWVVARAVGIELAPPQAALFMSALALSLAIPAAPASLGTYEFVGVTVLTALGYGAAQSLATIVLLRAVSTFPAIILGLVSTWLLHLRPGAILESSEAGARA